MKDLENIFKNIKNKAFQPIYFFHGEEPYYIDLAVEALENEVLTEDEKAFNQTVVYGKDTTYEQILALARQFPMMGDKQVIIVKEAQDLRLTKEMEEALLHYVENPVESTILVLAHKYKKVDTRKKWAKILSKNSWLHLSEGIKDYQLAAWIQNQMKAFNIQSAPGISQLLAEYLGNDLSRISNELKKLQLVLKPNETLDGQLVELHIGISKDYNVFELQKAIGGKEMDRAMRIAIFMGKNMKNNPLPMVIGVLYNYFSKIILYHTVKNSPSATITKVLGISPYFVNEYTHAAHAFPLKEATKVISILREIDLKGKGLGSQNVADSELLVECVFKILNVKSIKVSH